MLQFNRLHTATDSQLSPRDNPSPGEAVTSFLQLVHRQFPIILLVTFLTTALALIYLLITPPSYTANATMLIDTKRNPILQQMSQVGDLALESAIVASQVEILKSEKIAVAVINQLGLADDPEFIDTRRGVGGLVMGLVNELFGSNTPMTPEARMRRALDIFQDRLIARRVSMTNVLEISFRSYNPERAIRITNAVAGSFINDLLESRSTSAKQTAVWLQDRIGELREQALNAERAVVDFKMNNNIVESSGRRMND